MEPSRDETRGDKVTFREFFPFLFLIIAGLIWAFAVPLFFIYLDILRKKRGRKNG